MVWKSIKIWPGRAGELLGKADRARDVGDWQDAVEFYRQFCELEPANAPILIQYGNALKETGELERAEVAYRQALEADKVNSAESLLQLGHVLKLQGKVGEALRSYSRCAAMQPSNVVAQSELRSAGWSSEEIERVTAHYSRKSAPSEAASELLQFTIGAAPLPGYLYATADTGRNLSDLASQPALAKIKPASLKEIYVSDIVAAMPITALQRAFVNWSSLLLREGVLRIVFPSFIAAAYEMQCNPSFYGHWSRILAASKQSWCSELVIQAALLASGFSSVRAERGSTISLLVTAQGPFNVVGFCSENRARGNKEFVATVFREILGRAVNDQEATYFAEHLSAGRKSRESIVIGALSAPERLDLVSKHYNL